MENIPTSLRFEKGTNKRLTNRSAQTGLKQAEIIRAAVAIFVQQSPDALFAAVVKHRTGGAK